MSAILLWAVIATLLVAVVLLAAATLKLRSKYSAIIDVEQEINRAQAAANKESDRVRASINQSKNSLQKLNDEYVQAHSLYESLRTELALVQEGLDDVSFGVYKPHYDFDAPESFKLELDRVYESKKRLIKAGTAVLCPSDWTVNGSTREGAKMIKQESKVMLRAFNGEVDAAVAKVSWNNANKMEERIRKAHFAINELGSVMRINISEKYLTLALSELRLTYELEAKKQAIKEEQREIRERMREEELAQREFERAKKAAETEELRYQKALIAARAEIEKAKASEMDAIQFKISALEAKLSEAQAKLQHAVSMAQLTKSGHVYVISNVGSFGDDVYKIGMTRRIDPTERVDELGSASVPFAYDIHAMIYSTDAPALETAFHRRFSDRRVNMVNQRKEFFRISLLEIQEFALKHHASIEFTELAEAREYRQTLSLLEKQLTAAQPIADKSFPASLVNAT